MWNMYFSVPTFILLLIIAAAFFGRKRLPVRVNAVFAGLLAADAVTMVLDYASTAMDCSGRSFPWLVLWLFNYLFFAFFLVRSYYFFGFAFELLDEQKSVHHVRIFRSFFAAMQIFLFIGSAAGWIFTIEDSSYRSGPLYPFINIQFVFWIVLALVITASIKKSPKRQKLGVYIYLFILLCGVIVRALFPRVVIMNLFCLFAIQEIYLIYLNPDQYIDENTGLFNNRGWRHVLGEARSKKDFSMVGFGIRNFAGFQELRSAEQISMTLIAIGQWIRHSWPRLSSFYQGGGIFIISGRKPFDQQAVLDEINRRFTRPWHTENSEYYLAVNEMVLKRGAVPRNDRDLLRGTLQDAYHTLTDPEPVPLIYINEELLQKQARKREVHRILTDALVNDKLAMFLQPVVNARNGEIEGAEALCRLPDGSGGYIFPDEFIPQARDNGNMGVLGHQMFSRACEFLSREDVKNSNLRWVNVNVAPEQFRNPNILDDFLKLLETYDIDASRVHLEITEEAMIDRVQLHDAMAEFSRHGFIFSMDDFGSSYSNVIRLQQNHFSNVKVDREFTWSYFDNRTELLPDIVRTCHDLGMQIVAEGVETKEMADGVRDIDCDYIQGYYYSKPIPEEEFIRKYLTGGDPEKKQQPAENGSGNRSSEERS